MSKNMQIPKQFQRSQPITDDHMLKQNKNRRGLSVNQSIIIVSSMRIATYLRSTVILIKLGHKTISGLARKWSPNAAVYIGLCLLLFDECYATSLCVSSTNYYLPVYITGYNDTKFITPSTVKNDVFHLLWM